MSNADSRYLLRTRPPAERLVDIGFKNLAIAMASVVAIVLFSILVVFFRESLDSMARYGWQFLVTSDWNPVDDQYGAGAAIYGTLITSLLALLIAVPLGVGTAIFITENIIPKKIREVIGLMVELLAAIPSVVLGLWAIFVLEPSNIVVVQMCLYSIAAEYNGPLKAAHAQILDERYDKRSVSARAKLSVQN